MPEIGLNSESILAEADAVYLDSSALVKSVIAESPGDRAMRILYVSGVPLFTSVVGFGEVISCFGRKNKQLEIGGSLGFLTAVRMLLKDFEIGRIQSIEPPDERAAFLMLTQRLLQTGADVGGGDLWHVMAALELQQEYVLPAFLSFDKELIKTAPELGVLNVLDGSSLDCEILGEVLRARGRLSV